MKQTLSTRPNDVLGYELLFRTALTLGKFSEARVAQEYVLSIKGPSAKLDDYLVLLDSSFVAAGGRFSLESSRKLEKMEKKFGKSAYIDFFKALEYIEKKQFKNAIEMWKNLNSNKILDQKKLTMLETKLKSNGLVLKKGELNYD